jgi:hypothetical protein
MSWQPLTSFVYFKLPYTHVKLVSLAKYPKLYVYIFYFVHIVNNSIMSIFVHCSIICSNTIYLSTSIGAYYIFCVHSCHLKSHSMISCPLQLFTINNIGLKKNYFVKLQIYVCIKFNNQIWFWSKVLNFLNTWDVIPNAKNFISKILVHILYTK